MPLNIANWFANATRNFGHPRLHLLRAIISSENNVSGGNRVIQLTNERDGSALFTQAIVFEYHTDRRRAGSDGASRSSCRTVSLGHRFSGVLHRGHIAGRRGVGAVQASRAWCGDWFGTFCAVPDGGFVEMVSKIGTAR